MVKINEPSLARQGKFHSPDRANFTAQRQRGNMKREEKRLMDALYRKAVGYTDEERTEEFAVVDGELTLSKRRVRRVRVPPDVAAAKLYLSVTELTEAAYENMSEQELREERRKLIRTLEKEEENAINGSEVQDQV